MTTPGTNTEIMRRERLKAGCLTRLLAASVAIVVLAGCASAPYEGKYVWSEGWREGEVVAVQAAGEMARPRFYTCVRRASAEQVASTKFAVVKYRQMSRTRRLAVPLRPNDTVAPGQPVYVKVDDCATPPIPR